jgi:phenylpropionate dioxygenase-like ring-hydroxylating dioxygenase large terminal subunit
LLGRHLVVFRTADGQPRVLPDRCLHRGGALHRGAVVGDSVECPYHGWQWRGADGRCIYIPSNGPSAPIPKTAAIGAFPAVERYGLVWTCVGDPLTGPPDLPTLKPADPLVVLIERERYEPSVEADSYTLVIRHPHPQGGIGR